MFPHYLSCDPFKENDWYAFFSIQGFLPMQGEGFQGSPVREERTDF